MKKVKTISVENYQAILCVFKGFKGFICVQFYDVRWTGVVMTSKSVLSWHTCINDVIWNDLLLVCLERLAAIM